jgi:type VI secretion system Hcp family effector
MSINLSFETQVKSQGPVTGAKSAKFGNSRVLTVQQGFREITPSNASRDIRRGAPLRITAEFEFSSSQFFGSHGDVLSELHLKFAKVDANGKTQPYLAITLTNALVKFRRIASSNTNHAESHDTYELTEYEFTFQKIEIENLAGSTSATDDWTG